RFARKVEQKHVLAGDRALDARYDDDAAAAAVAGDFFDRRLFVVKRNAERRVAKRGGTIDELECVVRDSVVRIVGGMGVKIRFQHVRPAREWAQQFPRRTGKTLRSVSSSAAHRSV